MLLVEGIIGQGLCQPGPLKGFADDISIETTASQCRPDPLPVCLHGLRTSGGEQVPGKSGGGLDGVKAAKDFGGHPSDDVRRNPSGLQFLLDQRRRRRFLRHRGLGHRTGQRDVVEEPAVHQSPDHEVHEGPVVALGQEPLGEIAAGIGPSVEQSQGVLTDRAQGIGVRTHGTDGTVPS